jgi:hypothetical protein
MKPVMSRLKGIAHTDVFYTVIVVMFVITILWKAYQEFWKPKRDAAKKNRP